jgi:hypothetical protein
MNLDLPNTAFRRTFLYLALFISLLTNAENADPAKDTTKSQPDTTGKKTETAPAKTALKVLSTPQTLSVNRYYNKNNSGCKPEPIDTNENSLYPGSYLIIKTDSAGIALAEKNKDTFRLWINGVCFSKLKPLYFNASDGSLIFRLDYDTALTSPWKLFYAWPNYWTFSHRATICLGTLNKEFRNKTRCVDIGLNTTACWKPWLAYILFMLLLALIALRGRGIGKDSTVMAQKGILIVRGNAPNDADHGIINIKHVPFSLARFQFLFWLLIIFFSILHIWGITDILAKPTGSVLILLGISGGTMFIGRLIDNNSVADANTTPEERKRIIEELVKESPNGRRDLVKDLLNDGNGISLHRLQLFMFTIFLGIYFIWQVLYCLGLPQFSDTMMILMGISSGMYAGVKTSEK